MTTGTQWHVDADNARYVVDDNDVLVADCFADTVEDFGVPDLDDVAKNARLIAASPELLAALEACRTALANWVEIADKEDERISDVEALVTAAIAIAKAKGE